MVLVIWSAKRFGNHLTDDELESLIIDRRVQRLKQELRREDNVVPRPDIRKFTLQEEKLYEAEVKEDEAKKITGLGDGGVAVHLQGEEAKIAEERMKKEAFNIILSDKIPYTRTLPDARNPR